MRHGLIFALALGLIGLNSHITFAEDDFGWHGGGEFGLAITSGNSETETLNGRLELIHNSELWRHTLQASALNVSDSDTAIIERYTFGYKIDRKITDYEYYFGAFRYDDDRFSGFDFQSSLTFGIGRRIFATAVSRFDVELGLGYRLSRTVNGRNEDEAIGRFYGDYEYNVSENTVFSQTLLIEPAFRNTFSESITALKISFAKQLALKLSFAAKNNSDTPANTKSTDTVTTAAVVYSF